MGYLYNISENQKKILLLLNEYTHERDIFLQYTAFLTLIKYLTDLGVFNYYFSVFEYDYLDSRRFLYESKKCLKELYELRDIDLVQRASIRVSNYKNIIIYSISEKGIDYINKNYSTLENLYKKIKEYIYCKSCNSLLNIRFMKEDPIIYCENYESKKCFKQQIKLHLEFKPINYIFEAGNGVCLGD